MKKERQNRENPKSEKADVPGWWNDFYRKLEYVQLESGHWVAKNSLWRPKSDWIDY